MAAAHDLRRTLLDASLDLLAREGLEKLSLREVARRAGVSHQAPYHHFQDREALLAQLVCDGFEGLRRDMEAALAAASPEPRRRLTAIGRAYVAFALENPELFKLMFRSEMVKADHDCVRQPAQSAFGLLEATVREVHGPGKASEPQVLGAWSLAHGLASLALEGKLDAHGAASKKARAAAASAVFEAYEKMLPGPKRE